MFQPAPGFGRAAEADRREGFDPVLNVRPFEPPTGRRVFRGANLVSESFSNGWTRQWVPGFGLDQPLAYRITCSAGTCDTPPMGLNVSATELPDTPTGQAGAETFFSLGLHGLDVLATVSDEGRVVELWQTSTYGTRQRINLKFGLVECDDGVDLGCASQVGNPPGQQGGFRSPVSGLYDFRARMYSTGMRVWLSRDPLGTVDAFDEWLYLAGDPFGLVDPWGLAVQGPNEGAGAGVGGHHSHPERIHPVERAPFVWRPDGAMVPSNRRLGAFLGIGDAALELWFDAQNSVSPLAATALRLTVATDSVVSDAAISTFADPAAIQTPEYELTTVVVPAVVNAAVGLVSVGAGSRAGGTDRGTLADDWGFTDDDLPGNDLFSGVWHRAADEAATFEVAGRVTGQLSDARLGALSGQISSERLQTLAANPSANRYLDTTSGYVNVVQTVDGRLLRITIADGSRIISVGPIRSNQVANGVANGRFISLTE